MDFEVAYVIVTKKGEEPQKITIEEYVKIPTAVTVLYTTSDNRIEYYNAANEQLRTGKGIVGVARKRREYLNSMGESY